MEPKLTTLSKQLMHARYICHVDVANVIAERKQGGQITNAVNFDESWGREMLELSSQTVNRKADRVNNRWDDSGKITGRG